MKTIKFGEKEYVIIKRSELDRIVNEADFHLCCCVEYARIHKEQSNSELWRDFEMNQIMASANNGRKQLQKLLRKEA